jgi:hypothetical protein
LVYAKLGDRQAAVTAFFKEDVVLPSVSTRLLYE